MTSPLQILVLGVGDAFTDRHFHSSFVVMAGGECVQVDAPEPIRRVLREASETAGVSVTLEDIDHFILTHLHADHCSGFEPICNYKRHRQSDHRVHLHTSPEVLEVLWENRLSAVMAESLDMQTRELKRSRPEDYYTAHEMRYGVENEVGPLRVEIRRTLHMIPTVGLIVRHGDASIGYSCDTIFDPEHIEWLSGCDLIIHETNVGPHTALENLVGLPEEIRKKMRLIHYPDDMDIESSPIPCLRQGDLITVGQTAPVS